MSRYAAGNPCCRCCLKLIFAVGFSALVLWLLYRPIAPRYYLISLSLSPAPSAGGNLTSPSSFQLEIENKNKHMGIFHDPITLSLFPRPGGNLTAPVSGGSIVPAFYQGYQKTAEKYGNFTGGGGMGNGSRMFGLRMESGYRFKVLFWKSRHWEVSVAGDVEVGDDGKKTAEKGIRLNSAAASPPRGSWAVLIVWCFHYLLSLWFIY